MAGLIGAKMKQKPQAKKPEDEEAESPEMEQAEPPEHDAAEGEPPESPEPGAGAPQQNPAPGAGQNPDVQRIVLAAQQVLYDPQTMPQILQMLKAGASNPPQALARTTLMVMQGLKERSQNMPMQAAVAAGVQVMKLIGELAQAAGLFQATPQVYQQAMQAAQQMLQQQGGGMGGQPPQQPAQPPQQAAQPQPMGA